MRAYFLPVALSVDSSHMPASAVLFCLVVAIADGDTLTARCGDPGAYEQVKVRIAGIDAPEKAQPFGRRSRQALADLCHRETATIRSTTLNKYGRTMARCAVPGTGRWTHSGGYRPGRDVRHVLRGL